MKNIRDPIAGVRAVRVYDGKIHFACHPAFFLFFLFAEVGFSETVSPSPWPRFASSCHIHSRNSRFRHRLLYFFLNSTLRQSPTVRFIFMWFIKNFSLYQRHPGTHNCVCTCEPGNRLSDYYSSPYTIVLPSGRTSEVSERLKIFRLNFKWTLSGPRHKG